MFDEIDEIKAADQSGSYPADLPSEQQVVDVEELLLMAMPGDLRSFQLTVSNVVCGSLEPVTIGDPMTHTYLPEVAAEAWSQGLPREYLPICQLGDNYYFTTQEGEIGLWQGEEEVNPEWESIWDWAIAVWLKS